jgi:hypothetical protein
MTLTHLFRSEPGNYARLIASLLPKDISVETAAGEMDENQIDDVIARIQERLLDVRATEARSVGWPEREPIRIGVAQPAGREESPAPGEGTEGRDLLASGDSTGG